MFACFSSLGCKHSQNADSPVYLLRLLSPPVPCLSFLLCIWKSCSSSQTLKNFSGLCLSFSASMSAPKAKSSLIFYCVDRTLTILGVDGVLQCTGIAWLRRNCAASSASSPSTTCFFYSMYTSPLC